MPRTIDLTGQKFGRLTVLNFAEIKKRKAHWLCRCDCGNERIVRSANLRNGNTQSCGCLQKEKTGATSRSHGRSKTPEFTAWLGAKVRCYNPKYYLFRRYGGRGIKVCDKWLNSFEAFYADMGPKPSPKHSLDRHPDRDGNYEPENCRWATGSEQARNRSDTLMVEVAGVNIPLATLAEMIGISSVTIRARLALGWTVEKALQTPLRG